MKNLNLEIDITVTSPHWDDLKFNAEEVVKEIVALTLEHAEKPPPLAKSQDIEVSVVLSDDEEIRQLNRRYRGMDKSTNVLSFAALEGTETSITGEVSSCAHLGDLVISYETLKREATENAISFKDHFIHLLVHGTLHLVGYDHEKDDEAEIMESLEISILQKLGIKNPYSVAKNVA